MILCFLLSSLAGFSREQDTIYFSPDMKVVKGMRTDLYRIISVDSMGYYHGPFLDIEKGKRIAQGNYDHGRKHGEFLIYEENGDTLLKGSFKNDMPSGNWFLYTGNAVRQHIAYSGEIPEFRQYNNQMGESLDKSGNGRYYLEKDGICLEGRIRDHRMEGKWIKDYSDQAVKEVVKYKDGRIADSYLIDPYRFKRPFSAKLLLVDILGATYFYSTEHRVVKEDMPSWLRVKVASAQRSIPTKKAFKTETEELGSGLVRKTEYYNDKIVSFSGLYKQEPDSVRNGEFVFYNEKGKLTARGFYKDDLPTGVWVLFDLSGKPTDSLDYSKIRYDFNDQSAIIKEADRADLTEEDEPEEVFFIVENMPKFMGGTKDGFREYIRQNLRYPPYCLVRGISGRVFVQFSINKEGSVEDLRVIRGAYPDLDMEALRVVSESPRWTPGLQRGRPVKVQFVFPIVFSIN
jgi:TonB family protein